MRVFFLALFGVALVVGCASPSHPPKPSPYHYGAATDTPRKGGAFHHALVSTTNPSHGS